MRQVTSPDIVIPSLALFSFVMLYIFCAVCSDINKYESNHTGDGQTDGQTITEVRTGKINEFVRSNVGSRGVTERLIFMTRVIIDTF